jgi:WD40 repeat protein
LDGHRTGVTFIKWNPDDSRLISVSESTIVISDGVTGEPLKSFEKVSVNSVAWNDTSSKIVSGSGDKMVDIWDVAIGSLLTTLEGHTDSVTTVAWSYDGLKILSGSQDNTIKIWDAITGKELKALEGHSDSVTSVAWKHDDSKIISGSGFWDCSVKIWDGLTGDLINSIDIKSWAISVGWCRNNDSIVLTTHYGDIQIWDETSGKLLNSFSLDHYPHVDWNYHQSQFVSSKETTCRIWNNSSAHSNEGNNLPGHCVSWNSDETMILTSSSYNPSIWEAKSGAVINVLETDTDVVSAVWNHDETKLLVINYYDNNNESEQPAGTGDIQIWDVKTSKLIKSIPCNGFTDLITWNSQRNMIASLLPDLEEKEKKNKTITICNTDNGELVKSFECDTDEEVELAWSHDDTKIVAGSKHTIVIWSVETGNLLNRVTVIGLDYINVLGWSNDDTRIVTAGRYGTIVILDVLTGKVLKSWKGHSSWVKSVVWSPDDQGIVSGSTDRTIKIWDANTGELQSTLIGHTRGVRSLNWSRDGSKILSGSDDRTVKVWINRKETK